MKENNTYSLVGKGTFLFNEQLHSKNIGAGVPVMEASYIASPKSITYTPFVGYTWRPLSSYLFDIKESIKNSVKNLSTTGKDSGNTVHIGSNSGLNLLTGISINPNNSSELTYTYSTVKIHDDITNTINNIKNSYISSLKKGNTTNSDTTVNVITSFSKNESEKNSITYNTVTIPLTDIYDQINIIKNSTIGTTPPTSAEEEISISDKVGINVISNVGINGNLISYTYTPIKVDFTEINTTIQSIINYLDPPISLSATPKEIEFTGENYKNGVNAYVTTNVINTSLIKWESTDTENVKLNAYVGLNNIITPISYKTTSLDDKINISIKTTYFNGSDKTKNIEIPIKYNKTNGGLINISYTLSNEYYK